MNENPGSRSDASAGVRKPAVRAVFLVGFMGAGKTSVGRILSKRLGWCFEDLDTRIEAREQKTVPEIFRNSGEAGFRKAEHAALRDLLAQLASGEHVVAALGGGTFVQRENAALLLASDATPAVFLDTPVEELWERCAAPGEAERPLRSDPEQFRELLRARLPHYQRAQLRVETRGKSVEQVAEEILDRLGLKKRTPGKET